MLSNSAYCAIVTTFYEKSGLGGLDTYFDAPALFTVLGENCVAGGRNCRHRPWLDVMHTA
jgi:hypothetical protein